MFDRGIKIFRNWERKNDLRIFLALAVSWIILWCFPWVGWFDNLPWVKLGLAGFIFIFPGLVVSLILTSNRLTLLGHFISGLVLSMFLISSLGVVGKIAHLPFVFIKSAFFVIGLIIFLAFTIQMHSIQHLFKSQNFSSISIALLILMVVFGALISFWSRIESDGFTYLAYLTNWQHSQRLNFAEVVFGSGNLESIRFWLAMLPMNQAFWAEISNLHGVLLLGFYLKPTLVGLSLVSAYVFYEDLFQSNLQAIMALLLQFTFLFLLLDVRQPGNMFFLRSTEDKSVAAFVIAPVFFLAVSCFLESRKLRRGIFVLLVGWCLALMHPVILAFSIFIAGSYGTIRTITLKNYKTLGVLLLLLMVVVFPSASLRFVTLHGMKTQAPFDLESALDVNPHNPLPVDRISFISGTPFYGFNLDTIRIQPAIEVSSFLGLTTLLSWSFMWLLGFGFLCSLLKIGRHDNNIASFVVASALLVLLCAIPYTGWLVGYFVSARMLWRSPWLFPTGLVGVILMVDVFEVILAKVRTEFRLKVAARDLAFVSVFSICVLVIGYTSVYYYGSRWSSLKTLYDYRNMLEEKAALGNYIETNFDRQSIFLASYEMMNYLPGLSSKAKVVYFRTSIHTPRPVKHIDIERVLFSDNVFPVDRRMEVLDRYHIQYILSKDVTLMEYYAAYPQFFSLQKFRNYWLIKYRQGDS